VPPEPPTSGPDLSGTELERIRDLTHEETRRCLSDHGGIFDGDVAAFGPGVDQVAVWDECVSEVEQVVGEEVAQLAPSMSGGPTS
jgi:hypothetical protein